MRLFLVAFLAVASAGCATMQDVGCAFDLPMSARVQCGDSTLDLEDVPAGTLAFQLPRHWLVQRRMATREVMTIEAAERGYFSFTGVTLVTTFRRGTFPAAADMEAVAKRLAPDGAMIGPIYHGEHRTRFRWILRTDNGWRQGQFTIVEVAARPGVVALFNLEWPRAESSSEVEDSFDELTESLSCGHTHAQ